MLCLWQYANLTKSWKMVTKFAEVGDNPKKLPYPFTEFFSYIAEVMDIVKIATNEPTTSKKSRIGSQPIRRRLQDTIDVNSITRE